MRKAGPAEEEAELPAAATEAWPRPQVALELAWPFRVNQGEGVVCLLRMDQLLDMGYPQGARRQLTPTKCHFQTESWGYFVDE